MGDATETANHEGNPGTVFEESEILSEDRWLVTRLCLGLGLGAGSVLKVELSGLKSEGLGQTREVRNTKTLNGWAWGLRKGQEEISQAPGA